MSLTKRRELVLIAKAVCRELRRKSTFAEKVFWDRVRNRQLLGLKFYRQYPLIVDDDGRETFFVADFYCHERHLVIEIDGKIHDYRRDHDELRTQIINQKAIRLVRFTNHEIESALDATIKRLITVLNDGRR